ncbi:Acetyltransferase (GNAT) family protein [Dethiosulfatibacter aminovorans DSM 17477]|uniref:Acetyltransferase (GNAT) family protein n=1 Tax=Dethiosulfatibacter aminovorans DSM 17477 TaxID=1121476 RepID=A0A1M6B4T3_9FIRM|nr:GNAT family N-acetyltransferase [Dethiosulfatibacter aminovorans]SHI43715.1 Acetyltransferase (GNAT) family protein [Dethiosulfatibacter aminovorans DSM 17477]
MIRNSKPDDKNIVSELIIVAIEDLANTFTGYNDERSIKNEMENLFAESDNRFSHKYCKVIEIDGQVAASVISYPASEMEKLNEKIIERLRIRFSSDDDLFTEHAERIRRSKEAFDGEYYIDNLAVVEKYRGKGLSKILVEATEKEGLEMGYRKISILADLHNEKAFNIYRKLGYIKDCELEVLGHKYHHLVKTFDESK